MAANGTINGAPTAPDATSTTNRPKPLTLRRPSNHLGALTPPPPSFFAGRWHITHSTLPIWRDKRNVTITYHLRPSPDSSTPPQLDDVVEFQTQSGEKVKQVKGTQSERDPSGKEGASWNWHGKGLIKVASAHWELLGWGGEDEDDQWMVTYFVKTVFTPEGINVYSRRPGGTSEELLEEIQRALVMTEHPGLERLAAELYEIKSDGRRE
ncbi:hypothetical protein MPH_10413 [Macrophomina phaseolina MS6]|uniref:Uncharacterized protein n=2 Tax=Macrophomina phaseolina TaxID=35725 RepID=K2QRD7_MACPH|nr:hypothetical protein MPH_10413 [Macrophomina phaseolina MS6]